MSRKKKRHQRARATSADNAPPPAPKDATSKEAASEDAASKKAPPTEQPDPPSENVEPALEHRHRLYGWWSLALFVAVGLVLEALHGFKLGMYLDVGQETRRLLWTLAHAHGTLLALVNLALASALGSLEAWTAKKRSLASSGILGGSLLLPLGFFLGGLSPQGGDPGLGVILVPVGGVLLLVGVVVTATAVGRRP